MSRASASTTSEKASVPRGLWLPIVLVGLVGQLAWTVENLYLNVFVYETITSNPTVIAVLVAASAVTATVTTLAVGAWSDRSGRRRGFISGGYVLWGLATAAFGLIAVGDQASDRAVLIAVVTVVALDCLMTMFGSTANDAAYQAWVTDVTTPPVRGRIDSVVQVLPLMSMLIVFLLLDPLTRGGHWLAFFSIVGGTVTLVGLLAHFLIRDIGRAPVVHSRPWWRDILGGFGRHAVRSQPLLYLTLAVWGLWGISTQVYMPFLLIYLDHYLHLSAYALVLGGALIIAAVATVLSGPLIDRFGKARALIPVMVLYVAGLLLLTPARGSVSALLAGAVVLSGLMMATAVLAAISRDLTPQGRAGHVQGLRMVAVVMLPMLIGPFIGAAVIRGSNQTYVDLGVERIVPTPAIFLAAAALGVVAIAPAWLLRRRLST